MADENDQKLAYFQEITGMTDTEASQQILEAYGWDLDQAVHAMVDKDEAPPIMIPDDDEDMRVDVHNSANVPVDTGPGMIAGTSASDPRDMWMPTAPAAEQQHQQGFVDDDRSLFERIQDGGGRRDAAAAAGGMQAPPDGTTSANWRVVTLPLVFLLGSYNLMYGVVGLGLLLAGGGLVNAGLGAMRWTGVAAGPALEAASPPNNVGPAAVPQQSGASEAAGFLEAFEAQFGFLHPDFQAVSFLEALRRAGHEFKYLFVYLHDAQNVNTPVFCETTLSNEAVVDFVNENFVAWGADVHQTEGYHMSTSLNASTFPFCAIISGSSTDSIAVVRQAEGYQTAGELLTILQQVIEEQQATLNAGRQEQEARSLALRLREEQDEAYRIGLQADQERERIQQAEEVQAARERENADQKRVQEEKEAAEAAEALAQKEANLAQVRRDKALNLGPEPERGADVTHVAVRLPSGERKERRFFNTAKVQALYDYIESMNVVESDSYLLISNFPRVVYGPDKLDLTLVDAGLHPRTNLFVQVQDS